MTEERNMKGVHSKSTGDWYFAHVLAVYSIVTLIVLLSVSVVSSALSLEVLVVPAVIRALLGVGIFVAFWLWIRMLVDYFRERPSRHSVLWGWVLLLASVVGSIPYFWLVWRPRNRPA